MKRDDREPEAHGTVGKPLAWNRANSGGTIRPVPVIYGHRY